MRKTLAGIGIIAVALAGCATTHTPAVKPAPTATTSGPTVAQKVTPAPAPKPAAIRSAVPQNGLSAAENEAIFFKMVDEQTKGISHKQATVIVSQACDKFDEHKTLSEITSKLGSTQEAVIVGAGVSTYCPQHNADVGIKK
jgi:nitrous oxide reductase accessory protein NosL